jgi:hypothetical protein
MPFLREELCFNWPPRAISTQWQIIAQRVAHANELRYRVNIIVNTVIWSQLYVFLERNTGSQYLLRT